MFWLDGSLHALRPLRAKQNKSGRARFGAATSAFLRDGGGGRRPRPAKQQRTARMQWGCVLLPAKCTARSWVKSNAAGRALAGQRRGAAARANHRVWSAVSVRRRVMVNDRPGTDPKRSRQIGRSRGHATCRLPWAALRGVEGLIPALRFQKEGGRRGRASGARRAAS